MSEQLPCMSCLRRSWLLDALTGYIEHAARNPARLFALLEAADSDLLALGGRAAGGVRRGYDDFDADAARALLRARGLSAICSHDPRYPSKLRALGSPPAVINVAGSVDVLSDSDPVAAVVGTRAASEAGCELARSLAHGLTAAGVMVVSGMALGIDGAAHHGALEVSATVAVLAGAVDVAYPRTHAALYRRIVACGGALSEAPVGASPRRWTFLARNRLIAALADAVVVVEAPERSGSLLTCRLAAELGKPVGAVPGAVGSRRSAGPHALIRAGAVLVRDAQDALDLVCGDGQRCAPAPGPRALDTRLRCVADAVSEGASTPAALTALGFDADHVLKALAELELLGELRRTLQGTYLRVGAARQ